MQKNNTERLVSRGLKPLGILILTASLMTTNIFAKTPDLIQKVPKRAALIAGLGVLVGSCAALLHREHSLSQSLQSDMCQVFQPISLAKSDTEKTKREIVIHNSIYEDICSEYVSDE